MRQNLIYFVSVAALVTTNTIPSYGQHMELVEKLSSKSERAYAQRRLRWLIRPLPPEAVDRLLEMIETGDDDTRKAAAYVLALDRRDWNAKVEILKELLKSGGPRSIEAAQVLAAKKIDEPLYEALTLKRSRRAALESMQRPISVFHRTRTWGPECVDPLSFVMKHGSFEEARLAASILARNNADQLSEDLLYHPKARCHAAFVLGHLRGGPFPQATVDALINGFETDDDYYKTEATVALRSIGYNFIEDDNQRAIYWYQLLRIEGLHDPYKILLKHGRAKLDSKTCVPALIKQLRQDRGRNNGYVFQAIGKFGSDAAEAIPDLIAELETDNPYVSCSVGSPSIALSHIGPVALPALIKAMDSEKAREFAICAFTNMAAICKKRGTALDVTLALPKLVECLADERPEVRQRVAEALVYMEEGNTAAIEQLVLLLGDEDRGVQYHARSGLRRLRANTEQVKKALFSLLDSADESSEKRSILSDLNSLGWEDDTTAWLESPKGLEYFQQMYPIGIELAGLNQGQPMLSNGDGVLTHFLRLAFLAEVDISPFRSELAGLLDRKKLSSSQEPDRTDAEIRELISKALKRAEEQHRAKQK